MPKPLWESTYADLDAKTFGEASQEVLDLMGRLSPGARVLDVGCGDGRNAIPLARNGFAVTALDVSKTGIRKLRLLAEREKLVIRSDVADMTTYDLREPYDVIIAHGCLHLLEREKWESMIERFRAHTAPTGFNVITVFTDTIPAPPDLAEYCTGLFREGELYARYQDWDIILQRSYTFTDEHPGGIRHTHAANKLVAQNVLRTAPMS